MSSKNEYDIVIAGGEHLSSTTPKPIASHLNKSTSTCRRDRRARRGQSVVRGRPVAEHPRAGGRPANVRGPGAHPARALPEPLALGQQDGQVLRKQEDGTARGAERHHPVRPVLRRRLERKLCVCSAFGLR